MFRDAFVAACGRSAVGKAKKGSLKDTRPEEIAVQIIQGVLPKIPQLDPKDIDDMILGCAFPEAEQGSNLGRNLILRAGLPDCIPGQTVNRFCSSGLQSIAAGSNAIMAGQADVMLVGGVESMSKVPMIGNLMTPSPYLMDNTPDKQTPMGITAENVADKYGITREEQDAFAVRSHKKADAAQKNGLFDDQIIPVDAVKVIKDPSGKLISIKERFSKDEGIRPNVSMESLGKLRPVFKKNGTVTAGNSSQMNDAAAMMVLMSGEKMKELDAAPIARFVSFAAVGVDPAYMGIGPVAAIPKALKIAGLTLNDIGLIELNEAFASQSLACIKELGLNEEIVNVNGGAIAMGHPLGCTGTLLSVKLLSEMRRRKVRYGLVSMCIGGGMGAAGIFELL